MHPFEPESSSHPRTAARTGSPPGCPAPSAFAYLLTLLALFSTGCPVTQPLPEQAAVQDRIEPHTRSSYLLYVPSIYTDDYAWPLVVACHGTWPYDRAESQMQEWARFAEYEGIIVVAPRLVSAKGDFPPSPKKQIALQEEDERALLATVSEIKRSHHIAEEKVFLTGWSAGAYPLLNTGLKHPDVFRALFIRQGNFDERFMDVPPSRVSRWQPIKVVYGKVDTLRDQTRASIVWLRDMGLWVEEQEFSGVHRRIDPKNTWRFFKTVIDQRPWIRIRTHRADPVRPLTIRFDLDAVPEAIEQKWFFGDGDDSYERAPIHTYKDPGKYLVRVNVALKGGKTFSRTKTLRVVRSRGKN